MSNYSKPEIEIITFLTPDVIVASNGNGGFNGGNIELPDHDWTD